VIKGGDADYVQAIELVYSGSTYDLFDLNVTPASGTVCSKIGKVTIIPDWPEGAAGFMWDYLYLLFSVYNVLKGTRICCIGSRKNVGHCKCFLCHFSWEHRFKNSQKITMC